MKTKILTSRNAIIPATAGIQYRYIQVLLYFLILNICLSLSSGPVLANEQIEKERVDPTPFVTDYLDKLRTNCACGVKEFELMQSALSEYPPHLANPIPKDHALLSSKCYTYWQNFETIVEKAQGVNLDYSQIRSKVEQLIYEIKDNEYKRDEARVKTENINIEMDFATIPKGTYQNEFIGTFEISQDVDIQTTPVTQYQWSKVIGDNPAEFKTGEDSRLVEINGKQIEMCPNKPVENVSYEMITEYIKKLNEQDPVYEYGLPSIEEYLALLGNNTQTKGSSCLSQEETCHVEFSSYQYLGNKRIYSISDNVLEFTRDSLQKNDLPSTNKILFGYSYNSLDDRINGLASITRPIYYAKTSSSEIGFRLIRYKKRDAPMMGKSYSLIWDEKNVILGKNYMWDETCKMYIHKDEHFDWMVEHKDRYSEDIQHTIDVLLKVRGSVDAIKDSSKLINPIWLESLKYTKDIMRDCIPTLVNYGLSMYQGLHSSNSFFSQLFFEKRCPGYPCYDKTHIVSDLTPLIGLVKLKILNFNNNQISDLTPLVELKNLYELDLGWNNISDLTPLAGLKNLETLYLNNNKISDITPLAGLKKLKYLHVWNNPIIDYSPLKELEKNGCEIVK